MVFGNGNFFAHKMDVTTNIVLGCIEGSFREWRKILNVLIDFHRFQDTLI